ncbi:MAG: glycosyltransferase family 9 protein [Lishizhenia sp.]
MKRVLIIRFSSIGDIVLTTPVIRCLKKHLGSESEIDFLTKGQYQPILKANPYLNEVFTIDKSTKEIESVLSDKNYDFVVDLHKNVRSKGIAKKLSGVYSSFPKLNIEKWLYTNFKIDRLPEIHIVDRYFEAVKHLGVRNDEKGIEYFIPQEDEVDVAKVYGLQNYLTVAIGAQFVTKQLPSVKLVDILKRVNLPIVLLGGKDDGLKANEVKKQLPQQNIINLCGKINLNQSASILKQSKVLLTHDTGLMHIAAAFDIKIVSVWGNTVPKLGMYAYLPKQPSLLKVHEVEDLKCRPCSKIGHQKCPKKHFKCMMLQNEQAIAEDINSFTA